MEDIKASITVIRTIVEYKSGVITPDVRPMDAIIMLISPLGIILIPTSRALRLPLDRRKTGRVQPTSFPTTATRVNAISKPVDIGLKLV
ncbi:MAG: hypothetical protein QXE38_03970, partial [Candidatus Methanomethylicia archaeon]